MSIAPTAGRETQRVGNPRPRRQVARRLEDLGSLPGSTNGNRDRVCRGRMRFSRNSPAFARRQRLAWTGPRACTSGGAAICGDATSIMAVTHFGHVTADGSGYAHPVSRGCQPLLHGARGVLRAQSGLGKSAYRGRIAAGGGGPHGGVVRRPRGLGRISGAAGRSLSPADDAIGSHTPTRRHRAVSGDTPHRARRHGGCLSGARSDARSRHRDQADWRRAR